MKPLFITFIFLVYAALGLAQQVTTITPMSSGIDDALFITSTGKLIASGFNLGNLYEVGHDSVSIITSVPVNCNGLSEDSQGNLFFVDYGQNRVYKMEPGGNISTFVTITRPSGMLKMPDSDTLLVTSFTTDRIYKVAPDGTSILYLDDPLLEGPVGLAYDEKKRLFIGNFNDEKILYVDSTGVLNELCTLPNGDLGFITYARGSIYATVIRQHKIYKANIDNGGFEVFAGSGPGTADGDKLMATFNGPNGIVANKTGDTLYVSDFLSQSVRMITGYVPPSTSIEKNTLAGVEIGISVVSGNGNIDLVIDSEANLTPSLQVIDLTGKKVYQHGTFTLRKGKNKVALTTHLNPGVYVILLESKKGRFAKKFVYGG